MSRFVIWSDLHIEFQSFNIPDLRDFDGPIDGVLLAGDTHSGRDDNHLRFAEHVSRCYGVPVVMVLGNHEFYGLEVNEFLGRQKSALAEINVRGADVRLLSGDATTIGSTRIVGATLWTDFDLDPASVLKARQYAEAAMNDYRIIYVKEGGKYRRLTANDTVTFHQQEKADILKRLRESHDGPTLVMTHHMPIRQAVHAKYMHDPINAAFASNLLREIEGLDFDFWLYGHSHDNYELEISEGRKTKQFVSNPRGYPHEVTRFDPLRIIEV